MPGVFVLNDTSTFVSLEAAHFASEDDFQVLLAKFPELLAGDQIDPSNPRRWVLVRRVRGGVIGRSCCPTFCRYSRA